MNPEIAEMIGDEGLELQKQFSNWIPRGLALLTIRDYCCSVCWGHLNITDWRGDLELVECAVYGSEHGGFVTKFWAEKQRQLDLANSMDAKDMLRKIGIIKNENAGKSKEQLLKELGF
jgi:hypothetical protein